jgi:GNAT superfamily N-acetyltransferase
MSSPTVREPAPDDELEVAEVDRLATATLRAVYRPTAAALEHRATTDANGLRLVAVLAARIVGVVQYRLAGDHLFLSRLGVHPAFRRRGVAAALIRQLEIIGRTGGCIAMVLHTVRETGNVRIFERLGFRVLSEQPTDLFQSDTLPVLSEVVMRKELAPGGQPA